MSQKMACSAWRRQVVSFFWFVFISKKPPTAPMEASNHIGDEWNIVWGNCVFIWNSFGCRFVSAVAAYFHFQLGGNKSSPPPWTPFRPGKVVSLDCFFHLAAVVKDCDFMQTNLIVFVVYWYFASLRILCNHVVILPISMWTLPTHIDAIKPFLFFFLPSSKNWTFPFNDLLPNWYKSLFPAWFYRIFLILFDMCNF